VAHGTLVLFDPNPTKQEGDFVWLYGLLPCANSALVIARIYGAGGGLYSSLAAALSLNKLLAFFMLFMAAVLAEMRSVHELLHLKNVFSEVTQSLCPHLCSHLCSHLSVHR